MWETSLVLLAVAGAAAWLVRRGIRFFRGQDTPRGCGVTCGGCPARNSPASSPAELVRLDLGALRRDASGRR